MTQTGLKRHQYYDESKPWAQTDGLFVTFDRCFNAFINKKERDTLIHFLNKFRRVDSFTHYLLVEQLLVITRGDFRVIWS